MAKVKNHFHDELEFQRAYADGEVSAAHNDVSGHCVSCGRDNSGHEGEPCADDCPMYWEDRGVAFAVQA